MFNSFIENRFNYILFSFYIGSFIFVLSNPILKFPDSEGYLSMSIIRSSSYPIFLNIIKNIFNDYYEIATIFIQFLINALAIHYFINTIKKTIHIHKIWLLVLSLVLLLPHLYNLSISNRFLSEALAYPLYLTTVSLLILSFLKEQKKYLYYVIPVILTLLNTRSQFLYLIPISIAIILWISFKKKEFKKNLLILVVFIAIPFISSLIDKTYHAVKHGHFISTPWTGIHLITPAFFVSDIEDASVYKQENEKQFFNTIFNKLEHKKLTLNQIENKNEEPISFYISEYTQIANHTIYKDGLPTFNEELSKQEKIIELDLLTKKMTLPLVLDNFKEWIKIYIKNYSHAFGNNKILLLYLIIFGSSLFIFFKRPTNKIKVILLGSFLVLSHVAIVSIGIHTIKRFTFYNDWVLFLIIFILLHTFFKVNKIYDS